MSDFKKFTGNFGQKGKSTRAKCLNDDLKRHFITALSELLTDRTALLEDGRQVRKELLDFSEIEEQQRKVSQELSIVAELIRKQITENAAREQSQTAYTEQYDSLAGRYEVLQVQFTEVLWNATVYADERLVFRFKNGVEIGVKT